MNKFNKRGLVAIILFHQKCKERYKKGYSYFCYFWDVAHEACAESKGHELLNLSREKLAAKAKRTKGKHNWFSIYHISMVGGNVTKFDR